MSDPITVTLGSGNWTISAPSANQFNPPALNPDVTYTWNPVGTGGVPTLNVTFDMKPSDMHLENNAHFKQGIEFVKFTAPPAPASINFGARINVVVTVKNDTGVNLNGFVLSTTNAQYEYDNNFQLKLDKSGAHPTNYAHFHGETPTTAFPGQTVVLQTPDEGNAPGGPAATTNTPAASVIRSSTDIANGASVTSMEMTLHSEELAGPHDNSFYLNLAPRDSQITVPVYIEGVAPAIKTDFAYNPFADVKVHDTSGKSETARITITDYLGNALARDDLGEFLPNGNLVKESPGVYRLNKTTVGEVNEALKDLIYVPKGDATLRLTVDNGATVNGTTTGNKVVTEVQSKVDGPTPATTVVTDETQFIVDASGNKWGLKEGQVTVNGVIDQHTQYAVQLVLHDGRIYHENAVYKWYSVEKPTDTWSPGEGSLTAPPGSVPLTQSPDNTVITKENPVLIDATGHTYAIYHGQVLTNGQPDPTTNRVIRLAYENGKIWQENADHLWWAKTNPSDTWSPGPGTSVSPIPGGIGAMPEMQFISDPSDAFGVTDDQMPALALSDFRIAEDGAQLTSAGFGDPWAAQSSMAWLPDVEQPSLIGSTG